jgi:hypothetical protein
MNIDNQFELSHIVGILITLKLNHLIVMPDKTLISIAKGNASKLQKENKIIFTKYDSVIGDSFMSLGYQNQTHPLFITFKTYLTSIVDESKTSKLKKEAKELLQNLNADFNKAWPKLIFSNNGESLYYDVPVLKYIPSKDLYSLIISLHNRDIKLFAELIEDRYQHPEFYNNLKAEKSILEGTLKLLIKHKAKHKGKISGLMLEKQLIPSMERAIKKL